MMYHVYIYTYNINIISYLSVSVNILQHITEYKQLHWTNDLDLGSLGSLGCHQRPAALKLQFSICGLALPLTVIPERWQLFRTAPVTISMELSMSKLHSCGEPDVLGIVNEFWMKTIVNAMTMMLLRHLETMIRIPFRICDRSDRSSEFGDYPDSLKSVQNYGIGVWHEL